ncbi:hypothetical protein FNV43_RR15030 [Rhamnella rubrinervis]|uniref:Uncharacterized protein n=1 Tax=Rhamnella rubrinervis TaxID=2594499 RepID=A0A8K0E7X5_9ROSA|nr:hypothetical protein FNV43_RR15030 [Rhamnella rubrinervis]
MGPLNRLRKASDKSTKATIATEATATKKMSREVEESSNALQASGKLAEGHPLVIHWDTPQLNLPKGVLLLYNGILLGQICQGSPLVTLDNFSTKYAKALAKLAKGCPFVIHWVSRRIIPKGAEDIAHLRVISNLQVALTVIYNKLQKGIDKFEALIFGDFTRMKTVQFYGGFVHHLLLR